MFVCLQFVYRTAQDLPEFSPGLELLSRYDILFLCWCLLPDVSTITLLGQKNEKKMHVFILLFMFGCFAVSRAGLTGER